MEEQQTVYVIACGVLGPEIKHLANEFGFNLQLKFLPGKLHNKPDLLRTTLQAAIDEVSEDPRCSRIIVGYGLCGKGTVNIVARSVPLVLPKIHDCIALFLGSDKVYKEQFAQYPGTYYFTEGWHSEKEQSKDEKSVWVGDRSVGCIDLEKRFGKKGGKDVADFFSSWTANYKRAVYIDTGVAKKEQTLEAARQMANENRWNFEKLSGDLSLLKKLLSSSQSDDDIVFVPAGDKTIYSGAGNCLESSPVHSDSKVDNSKARVFVLAGDNDEFPGGTQVRYGLGVDAGGTYTDGVIYDFHECKIVAKNKALTTKWDFSIGINDCLSGLPEDYLNIVEFVSVSTTLATNAIVEGEGQKVGLLLMDPIGLHEQSGITHTPRKRIKGAMTIRGKELAGIDPDEVRRVVHHMVEKEGVAGFAVSGYGGSINPLHEQQVKAIIVEETGMVVCSGHDFSSKLNFATRAQTAVINGRVIPRMILFFTELEVVLGSYGIEAPVMVVKGDGTLISKNLAKERPVETVFSGPAASVAGARHLTHLDNAMVVDIGGTTTDTADIIGGEVTVSVEGAMVGGLQTHVRALDMKTVGLGGDSHIKYRDGLFTLGPRRVAPLVWANWISEGALESAFTSMKIQSIHTQEQVILVALEGSFNFTPTPLEQKIYLLLRESPKTPEQVAATLDLVSSRLLRLERLEHSGLVQPCGLTPTDVFHVRKVMDLYPSDPACEMLEILSRSLKKDVDQLAEQFLGLIHESLSLELLNNSVFSGFKKSELESSPLYSKLCDSLLQRDEGVYGLKAIFDFPVVGIGAPSSLFLPAAAEKLQVELVIPEDGDVANALGAVTSHVLVNLELTIRPDPSGSYIVEGIVDTPSFRDIGEAEEWTVSYLTGKVQEAALEAGTKERQITFTVKDSCASFKDGSSLLLERRIFARLKGSPDFCRIYP